AEDGIRDFHVTGVQTCVLPIYNGKSNAADFTYQHTGLAIQLAGLDEIRTDATFEILRFTNIDERTIGIPILIHPRPVRYLLKCFTVVKFGHSYLILLSHINHVNTAKIFRTTAVKQDPLRTRLRASRELCALYVKSLLGIVNTLIKTQVGRLIAALHWA